MLVRINVARDTEADSSRESRTMRMLRESPYPSAYSRAGRLAIRWYERNGFVYMADGIMRREYNKAYRAHKITMMMPGERLMLNRVRVRRLRSGGFNLTMQDGSMVWYRYSGDARRAVQERMIVNPAYHPSDRKVIHGTTK
jgi:hypothetical protein